MNQANGEFGSELAAKRRRVSEYLESHRLDAVLLGRRCNFSWYTGGARNYVSSAADVGNSWLLADREGAKVLTTNIEAPRLEQEDLPGRGIEVLSYPYFEPAGLSAALEPVLAGRRVAADVSPPGLALPALDADFDRLRWTLTEWEIARYRGVCTDTALAVEAAARRLARGQAEHEAAGLLADELRRRGCLPWVLLVAADERIRRFRHPLPTGRRIEQVVMLVACAERGGLVGVCTRLACFGPLPEELAGRHRAVVTVDAAMIATTRPGATLGEVFEVARQAYAAVGYGDQWQLHHQGGSCGYLPREVIAGPGMTVRAMANQAFAWNPSITGTKSEDTILCTDRGPELLRQPTDWPTLQACWQGQTMPRPDILRRD